MVPSYNEGDLVKVIGPNGVRSRGGYRWTDNKYNAVGHVYEVSSCEMEHDVELDEDVPIYVLAAFDGDVPPSEGGTSFNRPYHWAEEWIEPAGENQLVVDDQDFDFVFD